MISVLPSRSKIALFLIIAAGMLVPGADLITTDAGSHPMFPYPVLPEQQEPIHVFATDIDDDGVLDLVVTWHEPGHVAVHLGNGDGTFQPGLATPIDDITYFAALGDFNEDGLHDVAVTRLSSGEALILLGNGDGTFGPPSPVSGSTHARRVAVGDFNDDDHDDLAICGGSSDIFFGNGDGTFGPGIYLPGAGQNVAAGDLDGDGIDDLAYSSSDKIMIVLSNGDGSFTIHEEHADAAEGYPGPLTLYDLNDDDVLDIVATRDITPPPPAPNEIPVLLGRGDGSFDPPVYYLAGHGSNYVDVSDFDNDGTPDLVIANYYSGGSGSPTPTSSISVLLGVGGGSFADAIHLDYVRYGAYSIAAGDFDLDGRADLATPCLWRDDIGLLFGNGDGTFQTPETLIVGDSTESIAVDDLNGDDRPDIVTANDESGDVSVFLATGAGSFGPDTRYPAGVLPVWVAIGELSGDAYLDLAVANEGSSDVSILLGNGDGTFADATSFPIYDEPPAEPSSLGLGDFDGDDNLDLAVTDQLNDRVAILLGNGDGSFGSPTLYVTGDEPSSVVVSDFDGDEDQDLAISNFDTDNISVLLGTGTGTFTQTLRPSTYSGPYQLAVGDLNEDSIPDLAAVVKFNCFPVVCDKPGQVFLGNGDGTFADPVDIGYLAGKTISIMDVDGDDTLDIVGSFPMSVWLGNGDGTFVEPEYYAGNLQVGGGDFNFDGRTDLASVGRHLPVLLNLSGPGALTFEADRKTLTWPSEIGALTYDVYRGGMPDLVDLDDDGLPDDGYGSCMTALDDDPRDTYFLDAEIPLPPGTGFFYLIAVIDADGDGGIGKTSAGLERVPAVPCP